SAGRKTRNVVRATASGMICGPRRPAVSEFGNVFRGFSVVRAQAPAATSTLSIPGMTLLSAGGKDSRRATDTNARTGRGLLPVRDATSTRYGSETVTLSPVAEMLKVPDAESA